VKAYGTLLKIALLQKIAEYVRLPYFVGVISHIGIIDNYKNMRKDYIC